jgi:uncharacterized DUF497 family protein
MEIEYDPAKRAATLAKRGLDMAGAGAVFEGLHLTFEDGRKNYDETRYVTIGYLNERMVFVAWTWRGGLRRVISLRKANGREEKKYRLRPGERA